MKRFETEAAKQEAIDTLRLLMSNAGSDSAYRGYSRHLDDVLTYPVAPFTCAFGECTQPVEGERSYCRGHSSASWLGWNAQEQE